MGETSNGKNCKTCNKSAVCKYQDATLDEIEQLIETVKRMDLPISININCKEYDNKIGVHCDKNLLFRMVKHEKETTCKRNGR